MTDAFGRAYRWVRLAILTGCVMAVTGGPAVAQGQDGSIIGQLRDQNGGVLPGVTITATSPALQVRQVTVVTDANGEYRVTPLPIGTYTVQYELQGFQPVRREGIRLTAGFTARVDVALSVGALTETVTVSGAAPVIDTTSATTSTQLTREMLEVLPAGRSGLQAVLSQAPGVRTNLDVGGSSVLENPQFRTFGISHQTNITFDGLRTDSPSSTNTGTGNHFDYGSIEETIVTTVGSTAEKPTRGLQLNIIVKSGSNQFHGSGFWAQSAQGLQSSNIDDDLRAMRITSGSRIEERWDVSGDLGGRVVEDKLWFYGSVRRRRENMQALNTFKPDGTPGIYPSRKDYFLGKLSYQLSPSQRLVGFANRLHERSERGASELVAWESREDKDYPTNMGKVEWQLARANTIVSAYGGAWRFDIERGAFSDDPATRDLVTLRVTGYRADAGTNTYGRRIEGGGSASWYKPDFFGGNHQFKIGGDYSDAGSDRETIDRGAAGNLLLIFRDGVPFQMEAWNNPAEPEGPIHSLFSYVQDQWTIGRRLTLNLGVRYGNEQGFIPRQCRDAAPAPFDGLYPAGCTERVEYNTWNSVVPRLSAAYDLTGDGATMMRIGWGRFAHQRYIDHINPANRNVALRTTFRWNDRNGNRRFDVGEASLDPEASDFVSQTQIFGGRLSGAVPNPDEKQPIADEFSVSLERQLMPAFSVRVTGVYSRQIDNFRYRNNLRPPEVYNVPIINPDPGPDGRVGTSDDPGTFITYFEYPVALRGREFQQPTLVNDPRADESYKSFELAASKRLADRWQFMASYSATRTNLPFPTQAELNPNEEIFSANETWEWLARVSGAYVFPADVQVSANFEHRSGDPQARTVLFRGGQTIPSIVLPVEPLGSIRLPHRNLLNLRIEKTIRLLRGHRTSLRANVYNALNANTVIQRTLQSGANYLRPIQTGGTGSTTGITPPRIAEFSVLYSF